jgi:hypothetical protein
MRPAVLLLLLGIARGEPPAEPPKHSVVILSPTYVVDRIYKSMRGPYARQPVHLLGEKAPPELLWITGFRTEIVGGDGVALAPREFMCHINLDDDRALHRRLFRWQKFGNERLFTLSQGLFSIDFPRGFGLPIMSDEPLFLITQVLNHNFTVGSFQVRHKVTFDIVRDRDLAAPMKPLFVTAPFVMALLEGKDGYYGQKGPTEASRMASCLPGEHAPGVRWGRFHDGFGRTMTGHWVIKPGKEVRHTPVTELMALPFDTTLHYAAIHLHPFAVSLELRDLTTGRTVFKSKAKSFRKGVGLERVDHFYSEAGVKLYKRHEYELVSVYDNTSKENQDSMASMFLYMLDKEFHPPRPESALQGALPENSVAGTTR